LNNLGQVITTHKVDDVSKGLKVFNVTTSDLSNGIYYLNTTIDGRVVGTKKVIKL